MTLFLTPMIAGAIGSFFLFILLGLGGLVFAAALDNKMGKERALFAYTVGLLALTFFMLRATPPEVGRTSSKSVRELPMSAEGPQADPFGHPAYAMDQLRNVFQKYSDTRKLPPVTLEGPPDLPLAFPLPPTIPGPAPGYRRVLRGSLPTLTAGDGSAIAQIPDAVFVEYTKIPDDVYDWILNAQNKIYIYIRALRAPGGKKIREGETGFNQLKWRLARQLEGWRELEVEWAFVGPEKTASKYLAREDVVKRRQLNVTTKMAGGTNGDQQWFLRRSVENLYAEALAASAIGDVSKAGENALRRAARKMGAVGATGKEHKQGWKHAAELRELALAWAKANDAPSNLRADILLELLEAYRARRNDKAVLTTLAEFARTAPDDQRPWQWLGDAMLEIGIPSMGEAYYDSALRRNRSDARSLMGSGDAKAWAAHHEAALKTWKKAKSTPAAQVRIAEGYLRLGQLDVAKREIEQFLAREPGHARATLVRGAVYYALGDLATARDGFEAVATMESARDERAMACHNLGLTCLRLGQRDAAIAAFGASQRSLEFGAAMGLVPDETVSPNLGLALLALAGGELETARARLDSARLEAPRCAYIEFLAGVLAERMGNTASSVRGLESSKRLAPEYAELDGWLAITYLRLGEAESVTGADSGAAADYFRRAEAFAQRAARREADAEKLAFRMQLRLALVQLRMLDVPRKKRLAVAAASAGRVTGQSENRDQPAAHAILGYCHFGLGGNDNVKQAIRDLQKVLDDVPEEENHPWKVWRGYAAEQLLAVKRWDGLEEKSVSFDDRALPKTWKADYPNKVLVKVIDGMLKFTGEASTDGTFREPIVSAQTQALFTKDSFDEIVFEMRAPTTTGGRTSNNVVFGVQLLAGRGRGGKLPGIGFFYDRSKMAFRVGGGQNKSFEDGLPKRQGEGVEERAWPAGEWVTVRIARLDYDKGEMAIYVSDASGTETEMFRDFVGGFKRSRGKATLWFGGWSNEAERFDVSIRNIRVIRRAK